MNGSSRQPRQLSSSSSSLTVPASGSGPDSGAGAGAGSVCSSRSLVPAPTRVLQTPQRHPREHAIDDGLLEFAYATT